MQWPRSAAWAALFAMGGIAPPAFACEHHEDQHHSCASHGERPAFIASTNMPYSALVDDAMGLMHQSMEAAPKNGVTEHDFITMMIPHHEGAINMAKALLLHSKDAELSNIAQGIITEQENEIRVMRAWLAQHPAASQALPSTSK